MDGSIMFAKRLECDTLSASDKGGNEERQDLDEWTGTGGNESKSNHGQDPCFNQHSPQLKVRVTLHISARDRLREVSDIAARPWGNCGRPAGVPMRWSVRIGFAFIVHSSLDGRTQFS